MTYYKYNTGDIVAYIKDKPMMILQRDGFKKNVNGEAYMLDVAYLVLNLTDGSKSLLSRDWIDQFCSRIEDLADGQPTTLEAQEESLRQALENPHQLKPKGWPTY
jgi:hypothetical protein